ncbi:MAG: prephenate dehydrogenase [Chloroflexi bacterium]|nr:prephenate dehydrogenase [Chloroflexota bacterium]
MQIERVCIVGLGLMGGSLALALRPSLTHLSIVDANPQPLAAAQELADLATADFAAGARDADLIILATPVRVILRQLAQLPAICPDGCLVMDLGSTKAKICRTMEQLPPAFQAIGGHPMCGKETAGIAHADPNLYRGETFVLCGNGRTTPRVEAVAREIIELIGAKPLNLSPQTHDEMVAATSHLPYLVSAALMQTTAAQGSDQLWRVSASGFRDTTRLAGSDPQMLLDILLTNRTAVADQIDKLQGQIITLKQLLLWGDETKIADWLVKTKRQREIYENVKRKT